MDAGQLAPELVGGRWGGRWGLARCAWHAALHLLQGPAGLTGHGRGCHPTPSEPPTNKSLSCFLKQWAARLAATPPSSVHVRETSTHGGRLPACPPASTSAVAHWKAARQAACCGGYGVTCTHTLPAANTWRLKQDTRGRAGPAGGVGVQFTERERLPRALGQAVPSLHVAATQCSAGRSTEALQAIGRVKGRAANTSVERYRRRAPGRREAAEAGCIGGPAMPHTTTAPRMLRWRTDRGARQAPHAGSGR